MVEVGGEELGWGASDSREIEMVVERKRRQKLYTLEDGGQTIIGVTSTGVGDQ